MKEEQKGLIAFQYNNLPARVMMDEAGNPWWVAADVCAILDLTNPTESLRSLDDDEKNILRVSEGIPSRGNPNVNVINESGLYALIFRSNKIEARTFRKWITSEVLPQIRKTGAYASGKTIMDRAAKLTIFLNNVAAAGYCSFDRLLEYCWLRTLGCPQNMAGNACGMGALHQIQAIDRRLKNVGVRFPNVPYITRRKVMEAAFGKLIAEADLDAVGNALPTKEVPHV